MTLVSYETTNWGPHRYQKVVFPIGAKTIALCAENDQGKSWVVRGIGFCLSIGRNEYGDQTSIHDGETEATHKLVIEHKGATHTIEKFVRSKHSEEEGTLTKVNGEQVSRSGYEEFFAKTLGVPHPSIWLPIVIAMQNETDFHLRRKKSEREEALRAACQLTRVDSWKEALQSRVNEEDKALLAKEAGLKAQKTALEKEAEGLEKEKTQLETELESYQKPLGESGPTLPEILVTVTAYGAAETAKKKADLEHGNKKREADLAAGALERTKLELAKLPGASPEEESKTAAWLDVLQNETSAREKISLTGKLTKCLKSTTAKKKELAAAEKSSSSGQTLVTALEFSLDAISKKQALLDGKVRESQEALKEVTPPEGEDWEAEAVKLEAAATAAKTSATRLKEAGKAYTEAVEEMQRLCPKECGQEAFPDLTKVKTRLEAATAECAEFGRGALTGSETKSILHRVLAHWDTHPHENCPLCERATDQSPVFMGAKRREAMLESLEGEIETKAELEAQRRNTTLATRALETALQHEVTLKSLGAAWQGWKAAAEKTEGEGATLEKTAKALDNAAKTKKAAKTYEDELATLVAGLTKLHPEAKDPEAGTALLKTIRAALTQKGILEVELAALEREAIQLEEQLGKLADAGAPSEDPAVSGLSDEDLRTALDETKGLARTQRENRTARAELEKNLTAATAKAAATATALDEAKQEIDRLVKSLEEGCGMPSPTGGEETPVERYDYWGTLAKKAEAAQTLLAPLPAKLAAKKAEIQTATTGLEETAKAAAKAAAARRLVAFLDYKNAPRKLLTKICERLFAATNKIAEVLQADIRLKVGRNLDFLTLQYRAGRLIEQKSERLGFGKGAILGICFRLACQKLILPDTGFLILDEPTANVDTKRKDALKSFLHNLGNEKESNTKQTILIEHDLNVIELCQAKIHIGETMATLPAASTPTPA